MKRKSIIIILSVLLVLSLAALATLATLYGIEQKNSKQLNSELEKSAGNLENLYQRQYYELIDNVDSMQNSLSKLMVASSKSGQKTYLTQTNKYADASSYCLSSLAVKNESVSKIMKYVNQTGDYCSYLNSKLDKGEQISDEEYETLKKLFSVIKQLSDELNNTYKELSENGGTLTLNIEEGGTLYTSIDLMENSDVSYPSMIYDGPFSDALETREPKTLKGEEISSENVNVAVEKLFDEATDVKFSGNGKRNFESYQYTVETKLGKGYFELSKVGGSPVSMSIPYKVEKSVYDEDSCIEVADAYLKELGFTDMKAVWVSNYYGIAFINFAYMQNDVICYSDLIKVKVTTDNLSIVGLECLSYIYNHTQRTIENPQISEEDAADIVHQDITIETIRKALIPRNGSNEALCYEIYGMNKDEEKYFVYVDARTGEEIDILVVIDSEYGESVN